MRSVTIRHSTGCAWMVSRLPARFGQRLAAFHDRVDPGGRRAGYRTLPRGERDRSHDRGNVANGNDCIIPMEEYELLGDVASLKAGVQGGALPQRAASR